ncbi:MAG: ankyrin repeat domain-containing protein [Gammaproteobacteria bacterium]|nr:ankyrin repeat domain-containing protein [Gammaproteobacteria bacterium]
MSLQTSVAMLFFTVVLAPALARAVDTLVEAAARGDLASAKRLVQARGTANARDQDRWNSLMRAANAGHLAMVQLLWKAGADVNARNDAGESALSYVIANGHEKVAEILRRAGAR